MGQGPGSGRSTSPPALSSDKLGASSDHLQTGGLRQIDTPSLIVALYNLRASL